MNMSPLRGARVALLYSPGHLGVDYAASLLRGIERGLFELGARVATLNLAFFRRSIETLARRLAPGARYPADAPQILGMIEFLNSTWTDAPFDFCLALLNDVYLSDGLMEALRRRCRRIVNYPLNLLDQPHLFEQTTEFCDETFCAEEDALLSLQRRYGSEKIRYVPMAADPYLHRPIGNPERPRLLFVGSLYADRQLLLERCADAIDISIFGPNYDAVHVARGFGRELVRHRELRGIRYAPRAIVRALQRDDRVLSDEEFVRLASEHGVSIGFRRCGSRGPGHFCTRSGYASTKRPCRVSATSPDGSRSWNVASTPAARYCSTTMKPRSRTYWARFETAKWTGKRSEKGRARAPRETTPGLDVWRLHSGGSEMSLTTRSFPS